MILSSEGRSSGVLSILQDSVFPSAVAPRSLFRFGDGRDCVEDELEDLWFRLDIRQLFYAPNIIFKTLHSSRTNKNYGAEKTPPSAILLVLGPAHLLNSYKKAWCTCKVAVAANINRSPFCRSRCHRRRCWLSSPLLWSRKVATMVTRRHTSPLYLL